MSEKERSFVGVVVRGRRLHVEPVNFSLRKQAIFDRRDRNRAEGISPMEEVLRMTKVVDPGFAKTLALQEELAKG